MFPCLFLHFSHMDSFSFAFYTVWLKLNRANHPACLLLHICWEDQRNKKKKWNLHQLLICLLISRYIDYIGQMVADKPVQPHQRPVLIKTINLSPVPLFNKMKWVKFSQILNMNLSRSSELIVLADASLHISQK